ncbi:MAG: HAMP domain-containing histidine kinase [Propionibacteriaceae bacterium]|nr:HAMP domain-containing histidine kinase [Propionibacteriaceae bacterium]
MTLRNRVSLTAAGVVLVVLTVVSTVLLLFYAGTLRSRVDASLIDAAQQASAIASSAKVSSPPVNKQQPIGSSTFVTVGATQLELIAGPVSVGQPTALGPLDAHDVAVSVGSQPAYFADAVGGVKARIYTAPLQDVPGGGLVRASRAPGADNTALIQAALLLAGLVVAATGATYLVLRLAAGRILKPIGHLTKAAEHISETQDLSARLGTGGAHDEVSRLGSAFNTMLVALDESVAAQRQLVADASHELRTPLTSLTTDLDLLQDGDGLADPAAPALVAAARTQADELNNLITDMLDLARFDASPHREVIRLDLLAAETVQRMRQSAPEAVIETQLRPCLANIDAAAVSRAIRNLVDNALKWSPAGALVCVTVADGQIVVTDSGPGISDGDLPHIFERFYRTTTDGRPGTGLGLAIVARVAASNEGKAEVSTGPSGSVFTLSFPVCSTAVT